ncbi:hypothetical protein [Halobacteriovorax sp. HLS]|uniref:hypothetical protein n=1 Tax=Halobacteriovorax sp. HLS TaxID=2234000 RepID=UPI000FD6FA61|nr:hypothetical protein [Halobacteriovorax sp. HLS]
MKKLFLVLLFTFPFNLFSKEIIHIGRSPKALVLGDAYTARADDEYTLFYNPAALGRNGGIEITPLNPQFGITNALDEVDRFKDFPSSDPAAIADRLLGFPVYLQAGVFPGLKMATFGFNLFAQTRTSFLLQNATHPIIDLDYRVDRGFVAGFALNFGSGGKKQMGNRTSVGISIKHSQREGIDGEFDLFGTDLLAKITSNTSSIDDLRNSIGWSKGKAWGVDLGFEQAFNTGMSEFSWGVSILDVGGTNFRRVSGNAVIPEQEMYVNAGGNWKQSLGPFAYSLSFDLAPLNIYMPFARRFRTGLEIELPFISLLGGYSEGFISYGAELRLWPFKILAGFYSAEAGVDFKEFESKRAVIQLNLLDVDIDL